MAKIEVAVGLGAVALFLCAISWGIREGKREADHWYAEHDPPVKIVSTECVQGDIQDSAIKLDVGPETECKVEDSGIRCYHVPKRLNGHCADWDENGKVTRAYPCEVPTFSGQ